MPFSPNSLERFIFLTLNQGPGPILDMWGGPVFYIVLTAIRLNIFETLKNEALTGEALALRLETDSKSMRILLDTLVSMKYIHRHGDKYSNTALTRKWLLEDGSLNLSAYYQFWGAVMEHFMPKLEASVRNGLPPINLYEWLETEPEVSRHFQKGMIALTQYAKNDVIKALNLAPSDTRILDIGGGHAMYSVALCQKYPHLSAVVFDRPQALTIGRETIGKARLDSRITLQAGNFLNDKLGNDFDVALLFNIVHGFKPQTNINLLCQVKQALKSGGQVVILEQLKEASPLPILKATVQILSLSFSHLLGGQVYDYAEIKRWLTETGFSNVTRKTIPKAGSALIIATLE